MKQPSRFLQLCLLVYRLARIRFSTTADKQIASKQLLFASFAEMGGIYIKFLQILATSADFLRGWAGPSELAVFEQAPVEPISVKALLDHELRGKQLAFRSIETTPFATGSFAQVYRATLTDGTQVVVKVLRPSVRRTLAQDVRILGYLARILDLLHPVGVVRFSAAYRQFKELTMAETDYQRELANAEWFYRYFRDSTRIVIPKTYSELCTKHILVQEYVGGISMAELLTLQQEGHHVKDVVAKNLQSDAYAQLEALGTELLKGTLTADFVFGDPHPGNIKLLPNNKIGLIDFGLAAPAAPHRTAFLSLIREYKKLYDDVFDPSTFAIASINFYDHRLAQALALVGRTLRPDQPVDFRQLIGKSAAEILSQATYEPQTQTYLKRKMMLPLFHRTINDHNRFGIQLDLSGAAMVKAASIYMAMVHAIADPHAKAQIVGAALGNAIAYADTYGLAPEAAEAPLHTEDAFELVGNWLSGIADNDPFLYRTLTASIQV